MLLPGNRYFVNHWNISISFLTEWYLNDVYFLRGGKTVSLKYF